MAEQSDVFKVSIEAARQAQDRAAAGIKRKIAESERLIADYERRTKRPLATDLRSLARVNWAAWDTYVPQHRQASSRA